MPPYTSSAVGFEAVKKAYDAVFSTITLSVKFDIAEIVSLAPDWRSLALISAGTTTDHATGAQSAEGARNCSSSRMTVMVKAAVICDADGPEVLNLKSCLTPSPNADLHKAFGLNLSEHFTWLQCLRSFCLPNSRTPFQHNALGTLAVLAVTVFLNAVAGVFGLPLAILSTCFGVVFAVFSVVVTNRAEEPGGR
jgi:hypothetical protein